MGQGKIKRVWGFAFDPVCCHCFGHGSGISLGQLLIRRVQEKGNYSGREMFSLFTSYLRYSPIYRL